VEKDAPVTRQALREPLWVFAITAATVLVFSRLAMVVPLLAEHLPTLVAVIFLYVPVAIAWRRHEDLRKYGLSASPLSRSLAFGLGVPLVIFPLFLLAFLAYYHVACRAGLPLVPAPLCRRLAGLGGLVHPRFPPALLETAFAQLIVVAVPEELFFRGYLHLRLEEALPPTRRFLGGGVGLALVLSSFLFALGHVVVDGDPLRLAVFFPGLLFGWLRSATGSIAASAWVHAASNLYIETLHRTFFV
jgi:membrane protease YdiL (CAAX protease family)